MKMYQARRNTRANRIENLKTRGVWFFRSGVSGCLDRNGIAGSDHMIVFVQIQQLGSMVEKFHIAVAAVGTNDYPIIYGCLVGCGAVYGNDSGAGFSANGIGSETFAIGDVVNLDLFVF